MPTVESSEKVAGQAAILEFFGLREQPFGVTPDPRFLFLTSSHREALASLVYAIESKRGFSALIAEPGMGKTTLLFHLLDKLKSTARTAFLFRPDSNTRELLESLLLDLGLEANPQDVPQMHETLKSALLDDLQAGKHFVWVIDEAQDLDPQVLEAVRLLSNFETPMSKLMHILLAGQPELAQKLASPELLQLRQRVNTMAQLARLSTREVSDYIQFRTRRAGGRSDALFPQESRTRIAQASLGIPRNINHLCFSCMSLCFAEGHNAVSPDVVEEVLAEREPQKATEPPPVNPWQKELMNVPALPDLRVPQPQSSFWLASFAICFLLVPLLLVAMESNSRLGVLEAIRGPVTEDIVARVTGYDAHIPELPDSLPPALQPPKPPSPLPDSERRPTTDPAVDVISGRETGSHGFARTHAKTKALPIKPRTAESRVVFAKGGESLSGMAYRYYGKSSIAIIAKIHSHNPQIKDPYTALTKNQPVVLPDLAPEFPWKSR